MVEDTTIRISKNTKKRLMEFGFFGESWNGLLNRLADFYQDGEVIEEPDKPTPEDDEDEELEEPIGEGIENGVAG